MCRKGQYGQEIFTMGRMYLEGRQPAVHMHWRRFQMSSIPLTSLEDFDKWLQARWVEKEALLEEYERTGRFPTSLDEYSIERVSLRFDSDFLLTCGGIVLSSFGGLFVLRLALRVMGVLT